MRQEISVIIPVYNAAQYLERCVESIVYGEFKDTQIILVEDCSKDESWIVCEKLSEKFDNVECYQNECNSGVSYTRNHGLKKAKGKYILFVDSDDWVSGKYVKCLHKEINENTNDLIICGLHFIDKVMENRREYLWEKDSTKVKKEDFFDLVDTFLIQQLWNKIFHRDVIEKHNIQFDESQSMGEDFQFVLDYMEAARIEQCTIVNEPLYYYVRANNNSLMSKFGLIENENEYKRLTKLKFICGDENSLVNAKYEKAIKNTQRNYVYQVCRNKAKTNKEKIDFIENIMKDGQALQHFNNQRIIMAKEKMYEIFNEGKRLPRRLANRIQREKNLKLIKRMKSRLKCKQVSIISQNCIGGVICHDLRMPFLSPTINLYFNAFDFVKFIQNMNYYMKLELKMRWEEEYPVGYLDDIKIHFMHYETCREAKDSWERRKERICWDKILVLSTDMEGFNDNIYEEWKKITYPKILFTVAERPGEEIVHFTKYKKNGCVVDLIPKREFYKDGKVLKILNEVEEH